MDIMHLSIHNLLYIFLLKSSIYQTNFNVWCRRVCDWFKQHYRLRRELKQQLQVGRWQHWYHQQQASSGAPYSPSDYYAHYWNWWHQMHAWHVQLSGENNRFYSQTAPSQFKVPSGPASKTRPEHSVQVRLNVTIITARKRSLRRLCFHRCLSVHRGRGLSLCSGGGLCPGGSLSMGVGGLCQGNPRTETPSPRTVTSGRYATYWNAFLLISLNEEQIWIIYSHWTKIRPQIKLTTTKVHRNFSVEIFRTTRKRFMIIEQWLLWGPLTSSVITSTQL